VNAEKKIEDRRIQLGLESADKVEVKSGLMRGDLVVIAGRAFLKPGQKVEPKLTQTIAGDTH
jgi:hypothetical protein